MNEREDPPSAEDAKAETEASDAAEAEAPADDADETAEGSTPEESEQREPKQPAPRKPSPTLSLAGVPLQLGSTPTSLYRLLRPNSAVILLGLLFALALIEIIAAFLAYRERISEDDWDTVAATLEGHEDEPVFVASEWLGPTARMELPQTRRWDAVAPPDLRGFDRFWLLTHARERPWTTRMRAELEDLPRPKLVAVHRAGELNLHEFRQRAAGELRYSLLAEGPERVSTEAGRCRAAGDRWRCKDGQIHTRLVEVDYQPRRCLAFSLDEGAVARLELGEVDLGNRVRGHVGFGDFNARLRSDPTARVELLLDGEVAARWLFTDDQGWAAFALRSPRGRHELELRVSSTVAGTWQREGHKFRPTSLLCLELRSFDEAEIAEPEPEPETKESDP